MTAHVSCDRTRAQSGGRHATRACAIDPAGLACRAGRGDVHKKASRERANSLASWLRCRLVVGDVHKKASRERANSLASWLRCRLVVFFPFERIYSTISTCWRSCVRDHLLQRLAYLSSHGGNRRKVVFAHSFLFRFFAGL